MKKEEEKKRRRKRRKVEEKEKAEERENKVEPELEERSWRKIRGGQGRGRKDKGEGGG